MTDHNPATLDRIRKLLAQAEGAGTPGEAEVFTAKAIELMTRHGIERAMIDAAAGKSDEITSRRITFEDPYSYAKSRLIGWTAVAFGCQWIIHGQRQGKVRAVTVIGFESDLDTIELLYTSLLLQATGQIVHVRPTREDDDDAWDQGRDKASVAAVRRSWFLSFATEVAARVKASRARATAEADERTGDTSTALVLVGRADRVEAVKDRMYPNLRRARNARVGYNSGVARGAAAGRRADIGQAAVGRTRTAIGR